MKNEVQGTGDFRHGDGTDQQAQRGIGCSIRPGSPVPATVLVVVMGSGALLLQGWRAGPAAYLTAQDAAPVHYALAAAFGSDQHVAQP
ncbi:MAG: hypothetical protein ACRDTE_15605 [Pseudonocardiaceae bacterium]